MACFSVDIDVTECVRCLGEEIRHGACPRRHMSRLEREMGNLRRMRRDFDTIVQQQERTQPGTTRKVIVSSWLENVTTLDERVTSLLDSLARPGRCNHLCCFAHFNYHLSRDVEEMLGEIGRSKDERSQFDDNNLVDQIPHDPTANVRYPSVPMIGRREKLGEILHHLMDHQTRLIGVYGMGGIGKTSMMKSISQELSRRGNERFEYVIWTTVSRNPDILQIQKQIAECIRLPLDSQREGERATMLYDALRTRKSLVLMDDVWEELDLARIGIPGAFDGSNGAVVLLTTRSKQVCTDMNAQLIVHLGSLNEDESFELFRQNVSSDLNLEDPSILPYVDQILARCGGIPLVIKTIAKAVANYTLAGEWEDAVDTLKDRPLEIKGMNDAIQLLRFSYDALEDERIQSCLLYCSLFPEDKQIFVSDLIRFWIGEGLLEISNNKESFRRCFNRGLAIINKLKSACFLESGHLNQTVLVHDVVKHMASQIRRECEHEHGYMNLLLYERNPGVRNYDNWDVAKRILLREDQFVDLPREGMPLCPDLMTLIGRPGKFWQMDLHFPIVSFFQFVPSLRVLDFSFTNLCDMPESLWSLAELRHLCLRWTRIHTLPIGLGNLKKLVRLDLSGTRNLTKIYKKAIAQLSLLQSLDLFRSGYQWSSNSVSLAVTIDDHSLLKFEDLLMLQDLEDLGVDVDSISHLLTMLDNDRLLTSTTRLGFKGIDFTEELHPMGLIAKFPRLEMLDIRACGLPGILQIESNQSQLPLTRLQYVVVSGCEGMKNANWTGQIPSVESLVIEDCHGLEEVVAGSGEVEITTTLNATAEEEQQHGFYFLKLKELILANLRELQRISGRGHALIFPSLRELGIWKCPKLKRLSLGENSAKNIEEIVCFPDEQWDILEWEDDRARSRFQRYLKR